ncbi:MAG: radical SAM family heme chaperone HemW [Salinisphaera sp.]|nr:radical SAM family heme chaperone HemW [Salinisphaera sp.]
MHAAETDIDAAPAHGERDATPLSVYVHLPWCVKKCPYCDFNSHRAPAKLPETAYVDALLADWQLASQDEIRPIETVFFGGGTPSLFSPNSIARILDALDQRLGLVGHCEITLEANPGTTERPHFDALRSAGVNRLSLGIQSLDDDCLNALGRIHGRREALGAIADAQAAGFAELNCDLMFGLPGQDLAGAMTDLEALLACDPGHISYYQLTLEPGTPFHLRPPRRADDDQIADMFEAASERLNSAGYSQYEVSAWARTARSRHNENYWRFGDYLGIGAGAHGKRTFADGTIVREVRQRWPTGYMHSAGSAASIVEHRQLSRADARFECLLNGLRRRQGIDRTEYVERTGDCWKTLLACLQPSVEASLVDTSPCHVRASERGWYFLDSILAELA